MVNPRDVLNELKWREGFNLEKAEIWIVHRGAAFNTKVIHGSEIVEIEKSFIRTTTATIPLHRITKITYENRVLFQRSS